MALCWIIGYFVISQLSSWVLLLWQSIDIDRDLSTLVLWGIVSSHLLESLVVAPGFWVPETRRAIQALDTVRSLGFQSVSLPKPKEPPENLISTILPVSRDRPWTKPNNVHSRRLWTLVPPSENFFVLYESTRPIQKIILIGPVFEWWLLLFYPLNGILS